MGMKRTRKKVVVGVQGAPATLEEEAFVTQYEEDKHGAPVPANKNCVVAGKVREVEWKEPNEALITTLKRCKSAFPLQRKRGD